MRRFSALLASGVLLVACQLDLPSGATAAGGDTTGSTSAAGSTGTGVGATPCDGKKDCGACQSCALNVQCANQAAACKQSSSCQGIDQCFAGCGSDAECQSQCYALAPDGESTYRALRTCVFCDQCTSDCAGVMVCN